MTQYIIHSAHRRQRANKLLDESTDAGQSPPSDNLLTNVSNLHKQKFIVRFCSAVGWR